MTAVLSTRVCILFAAIACATAAGSAAQPAAGRLELAPPEVVRVPTFGAVTLYQPTGPPESVALFLSGDGGWNLGVVAMAERLRREGALVVGIDVRAVLSSLDAEPSCGYAAGPLEELSRTVQQRLRLPVYLPPVVVGYSSGATLAFAALASAPAETFSGGLSLGFCPDLALRREPCRMRGLRPTKRATGGFALSPDRALAVPWVVLQGESDQVCSLQQARGFVAETGHAELVPLPRVGHGFAVAANWDRQFVAAYKRVSSQTRVAPAGAPAPAVADLRLVEVPAARRNNNDRRAAVVLTGDGGWAELDKAVARGLADAGIPVVGWSSLTYYWSPRSPEQAAADLARVLEHYSATWQRDRFIILGYSFGADVAPFLVNRLSPEVQARLSLVLLAPSRAASFEFHVADWFGTRASPGRLVLPELRRVTAPVLCIAPRDESDSTCRSAELGHVVTAFIGRGHHFGGAYADIVDRILKFDPLQ